MNNVIKMLENYPSGMIGKFKIVLKPLLLKGLTKQHINIKIITYFA
jgi:hypothetical protein